MMADIVIRGMELPKSGGILCINIFPEGKVTRQFDLSCKQIATAVPLPEGYGDLIDRDNVLLDIDCIGTNKFGMLDEDIRAFLRRYTPIVPAEGGGEDGN